MGIPPIPVTLLTLLLTACQAQPNPPPTPAPPAARRAAAVTSQWNGYYGGGETFGLQVLRTAAEWDRFWRQVRREPPHALDLAREMAVVVSLGERNSGGYRVDIVAVERRDGRLRVSYREETPPPDAMVTQALTNPWAVAIVPRSDEPVEPHKVPAPARTEK